MADTYSPINIPSAYTEDFLNLDGPEWVKPFREKGWEEFTRLGFPLARSGNELWKYTNLQPLARAKFRIAQRSSCKLADIIGKIPWHDTWTTLTFVDGYFSKDLSNFPESRGIYARSLTESPNGDEGFISRFATHSGNAFVSLNMAFMGDTALVKTEEDAKIETPVQLLFITSDRPDWQASYPRSLILCGRNSSLTLIETHINLGNGPQLTAAVMEAKMEEGSSMRHYRLQVDNSDSYHISIERIHQSGDTKFDSTSYATGSAIGRYDIHTQLAEPGAKCNIHGIYLTTESQHQSNEISTTHAAPSCTSHQFFKGILSGKSRAVFSGKIIVERGAQKTEANQKDLNLLLSSGAEIDTKPSLEIYADDVKCAHGATAGYIDPSAMFYMQSRGLNMDTARSMLIRGFASEIVDEFELPELRTYAEGVTEDVMPSILASANLAAPRAI